MTSSNELFSPVNVDRISVVITDKIKAMMRKDALKPGDRLPAERDLCRQFNVSRVTVREALRVLEANGLVEIRVGARGGAFVTAPTMEQLGDGLADLMTLAKLTAVDVTETRLVIELGIIPLVIERATSGDLADLEGLVKDGRAAAENETYVMDMSAHFHERLAECAHNSAITMLVRSFHAATRMSLEEAQGVEPTIIDPRIGTEEHAKLVAALRKRDVERAVNVMHQHIDRTRAILKSKQPG